MTEQLSGREHQSLRRRIHGHVRGLFNDVEAFEVNPHRVGGIGDSSVSERVRSQEVAELIVPARLRNPEDGYQGDAQYYYAGSHRQHCKSAPPREAYERLL